MKVTYPVFDVDAPPPSTSELEATSKELSKLKRRLVVTMRIEAMVGAACFLLLAVLGRDSFAISCIAVAAALVLALALKFRIDSIEGLRKLETLLEVASDGEHELILQCCAHPTIEKYRAAIVARSRPILVAEYRVVMRFIMDAANLN